MARKQAKRPESGRSSQRPGNGPTAARSDAAVRPGRTARRRDPPSASVRIRMYRVGLGDCFLLTFGPGTRDESHVLVDCGTIGTGDGVALPEIVEEIAETTGRHLRAVVATHEHADHLSGFQRLREAGVRADEAWLAWTEDPSDPLARKLEKYQGDLFAAAVHGARALDEGVRADRVARERLAQDDPVAAREAEERAVPLDATRDGIRALLAFEGLPAAAVAGDEPLAAAAGSLKKTIDAMMDAALELSGGRAAYLSPGQVLEREWAPGVRFFVLGPPRDEGALKQLGQHGSPDLYELAAVVGAELPSAASAPGELEPRAAWEPFDREAMCPFGAPAAALGGVVAAYEAEPWRRIDEAAGGAAAELALQLDNVTNNTSLVLAIEVGGEVLLFPADAQLGSWLTWNETEFRVREERRERLLRGKDLLRRTRFYKVGHHGSHNATARPVLEAMGESGLTAFIPLDEGVARRKEWPMPARSLFERLVEKTRGRVTKSDRDADRARIPGVRVTPTYVEVTVGSA